MKVMENAVQLSMFMTGEQQQMVDRYIMGQNKDVENRAANVQRQVNALLNAGLRPNVHFKNNFIIEKNVTETVTLGGRYYDVEEFEAEVTYNKSEGGVFLLHDTVVVEDGVRQIVQKSTWFTLTSEGKVECSTIVGSYRAVKPETILRKLEEMKDAAKERLESLNQKDNHFDNALAQLRSEFPNATSVARNNEWVRTRTYTNSYTVDVVMVSFENGSYIKYDVSGFTGKVSVREVFDVVEERMTMNDKINRLVSNL
jgi:hypothetical protein